MGIRDLVDVLVGTDEVPHGKPAPDSALLALRQLGVPAEGTWYVGDALSDVAMALAAGMRPLGVTTGACSAEQLLDAGAELVVSATDDLAAVLLGP
jgi:phosphoglycolate phosphatase-like HAD superfamily hydrolase